MVSMKHPWSLSILLLAHFTSAKIFGRTISLAKAYYRTMGLNEFLVQAKNLSKNLVSSSVNIKIVLGNESCDLDSAVCALLYAYFLSSPSAQKTSNEHCVAIPILNIPASHLNIKTEVVYFLKQNAVPLDSLVFRDCMNLNQLCTQSPPSVCLVDHHVLPSRDQFLAPHVQEIIDHRPILDPWPCLQNKTMDIVGSCVTHVAKKILTCHPELIRNDVHVANLIYGTILLDTACLSPQANRATPADHDIINQLRAIHGNQLQPEKQVFESLQAAKSDVSSLSSAELLIKDLKFSQHGVPIAGFPILVQDFLSRTSDVQSTLNSFLAENQSDLLIMMGQQIRDGLIVRDLGVYSVGPEARDKAEKILDLMRKSENPALCLKLEWDSTVKVYSVGNVQVSRKQVLPLVERALEI